MKKALGVLLIAAFLSVMGASRQTDATAILDKAITALGGAEKLGKAKTISWKMKGNFTIQGNELPMTGSVTIQGLDHQKQEFESQVNGDTLKGVSVFAGDKGWRVFGDNKMGIDNVANEKRVVYLAVVPVILLPLKEEKNKFKLEALPEEKFNDKPVLGLKVTGPDDKEFKLYFDKETNLPVRLVAKVLGFQGEEFTQETLYSEYKDLGGIKKATKITTKRDGEKFIEQEITEFKILDTDADPKTFAEP